MNREYLRMRLSGIAGSLLWGERENGQGPLSRCQGRSVYRSTPPRDSAILVPPQGAFSIPGAAKRQRVSKKAQGGPRPGRRKTRSPSRNCSQSPNQPVPAGVDKIVTEYPTGLRNAISRFGGQSLWRSREKRTPSIRRLCGL